MSCNMRINSKQKNVMYVILMSHTVNLGLSGTWRDRQLRVAATFGERAPMRENSAIGAPVRRVAFPICIRVSRQHPLLLLVLVLYSNTNLGQPAMHRLTRSSLGQSRTVLLEIRSTAFLGSELQVHILSGQAVRSSAQGLILLNLLVNQQLVALVVHV